MKMKPNFKTSTANLLCVLGLYAANVSAEEGTYQYFVQAELNDESGDNNVDSRLYTLQGQAYLKPVDLGQYPYAEAVFLARTPFVTGVVGYGTMNLDPVEFSGNVFSFGGGFHDKNIPVFVNLYYLKMSLDDEYLGAKFELDSSAMGVETGLYLGDAAGVKIGTSKFDNEISGAGSSTKSDMTSYDFEYKNIISVQESAFINFGILASYQKDDEDDTKKEAGVLLDYYFNQFFGIGGGFMYHTGDNDSDKGKTVSIKVSNFFSPVAGVIFEFSKFMADEADNDNQSFSLAGEFRF